MATIAAACSSGAGVDASESEFDESYLQQLDAAGLAYSVEEVCHYSRQTPGEAWHFQVRVVVEASQDEVADALEGEIDVILRDQEPMTLQQYAGEPGRGWNGVLESDGGVAVLGLVKNNVAVGGDRPSVGWLPVCDITP